MTKTLARLGRATATAALVIVYTFIASGPARSDFADAKLRFDSLPVEDKVYVTMGLIATGDFDGLLDFGFTKRYYNSVTAFETRNQLTVDGILDPWEKDKLKSEAATYYSALNFQNYTHPVSGSALLIPKGILEVETRTPHGYAFERYDENFSLSFDAYPTYEKSFDELYNALSIPKGSREIAYKRKRDTYFVINGRFKGRNYYTWMSLLPGYSSGFTISWSDGWKSVGMKTSVFLANTFAPIPKSVSPPAATAVASPPPAEAPPSKEETPSSTGTGFKVAPGGYVLTNFHVAGKCKSITLTQPGQLAVSGALVGQDSTNDLALIKAEHELPGGIAKFAKAMPRAGSDIVVFGFPLSSLLAEGGNVVTGNVTSLAGIGNDSRLFQISAPVQPGNSGGPVMDRKGNILAVVVSKLDTLVVAKEIGDVPQNVNFAIKAYLAKGFLEGLGITFEEEGMEAEIGTADIAEKAKGFTYLISCKNG